MALRTLLSLALAAFIVLAGFTRAANTEPARSAALQDNLFIFTTADDFAPGEHDGTEVVNDGNGAVTLRKGATRGVYTSPVIDTKPFEYMILSWNADTPDGTYIEIEGRVHGGGEQKTWSKWLSWGEWSTSSFVAEGEVDPSLPGSAPLAKRDDPVARVATDELRVNGSSGETADKFQYRLILHGDDGMHPSVSLFACTIKNTLASQVIPKIWPDDAPDLTHFEKDLDVPTYSQYLRYSPIAGSICSPTSVAMALAFRGFDLSPEQVAYGVRDNRVPMFGNWPFNAAYAASHGLKTYVDYGVPAEGDDVWYAVKKEILDRNPVVVSVKYRKPGYPGRTEPEVENVPINYTPGHLVLVRGFTWEDGREYVIVNDPAARSLDEVRRLYPADQFFQAWVTKAMYVIHEDSSEIHQPCPPTPVQAVLVPVGEVVDGFQKYELKFSKDAIDLSSATMWCGVVSFDGGKSTPVTPRTTAEDEPNLLWFSADSTPGKYVFRFIDKFLHTYEAQIHWK